MTSQAQLAANRRNARWARNGIKHGFLSRECLVNGEREADLVGFGKRLRAQLAPVGERSRTGHFWIVVVPCRCQCRLGCAPLQGGERPTLEGGSEERSTGCRPCAAPSAAPRSPSGATQRYPSGQGNPRITSVPSSRLASPSAVRLRRDCTASPTPQSGHVRGGELVQA